jgi:hypothetical protein
LLAAYTGLEKKAEGSGRKQSELHQAQPLTAQAKNTVTCPSNMQFL